MAGLRRWRRLCAGVLAGALFAAVVVACSDTGDEASSEPAGTDGTVTDASEGASTDGSSAGSGTTGAQPAAQGTLRIGLERVRTIDPAAISPASVSDLLLADLFYDTLTEVDETGTAVPSLATFAANKDRTVWRFELSPDATFADGSPVSSDDVVFSLDRVRGQGTASLPAIRLEDVESVTAVSATAVDVTLERPSAVLPELLASPLLPIVDRATMVQAAEGGDQTPNASGEYSVVIEAGPRFVLDRRHGDGPPTVTVDLYETAAEAFDAFRAGEVDWAPVPTDRLGDALEIAGDDGLVPFHGGLYLGLSTTVAPLEDLRVRRAIALSIDRRAVVDAVFGLTAQPLQGIVPDGMPGWSGVDCRGPCGAKPDEAQDLVTAAFGHEPAPTLRLLVDDGESQRSVGRILENQLEGNGLELEVSPLDVDTYETLVSAGQQQLFLFGWLGVSPTPENWLRPLFSSGSGDNITGFEDDVVDFLLEVARTEPVPSAREAAWRQAEEAVLERIPVVPLVQFRTVAVTSDRVSGLRVGIDGTVDWSAVSVEPLEGE